MTDFALLLSLVAIPCFFIGLIWPRAFNWLFRGKATRLRTSLTFFGLTILSGIIVVSVDGGKSGSSGKTATASPASSAPEKPASTPTP